MTAIKYLSFGLKSKTGKNFTGKTCLKTKGSRKFKRRFRIIDFYFNNYLIPSFVLKIEYDPNRTARIALVCYKNGVLSYIIAAQGMLANSIISHDYINVGLVQLLENFSFGNFVYCIELRPNKGAKIARAAGSFGIILNKKEDKIIIRLPSGEERLFLKSSKAMLGIVSNINHKFKKLKKAGNNIWRGKKPIVRGVAKNCVDHPHGGGRGKTSKLVLPSNFTRRVLKGVSTVNFKYCKNKKLIFKHRKWKKFLI